MSKRALKIVAAIVVLTSVLVGVAWYFSARNAERLVARLTDRGVDGGVTTDWSEFTLSGFPFRIAGSFDEPLVEIVNGETILRWRAPTLDVSVSPLSPNRIRIDLDGRHELELLDGDGGSEWMVLQAATGWAEIEQRRDDEIPREIELELMGLTAASGDAPHFAAARITLSFQRRTGGDDPIDAIPIADRPSDAPAPRMASAIARIRIENISLPPGLMVPFEQPIDVIEIDLALAETLPNRAFARPNAADFTAWRDAGGYLAVRRAHIGWGPLSADANGRLALDQNLQPRGRIDARASGLDAVIGSMEAAQMIDANVAMVARLALIGLGSLGEQARAAAPGEAFDGTGDDAADEVGDGARKVASDGLRVPLTIADNALRLGPLTIVELPPLRLADAP